MVMGRARVRLQELTFQEPYRRAIATAFEPASDAVSPIHMAGLHSAIGAFTSVVRDRDPSFKLRLPKDADAPAIADACAHQLIISPTERQRVLEALDVSSRVRIVTEVLTIQRATLSLEPQTLN